MTTEGASTPQISASSAGEGGQSAEDIPGWSTTDSNCSANSDSSADEISSLMTFTRDDSTNTSKKGELRKRNMWGKWKVHYYMLNDGNLVEFKGKSDLKPHKVIQLRDCSICRGDTVVNKKHVISIAMPKRDTFFLQARTEEELEDWQEAMQQYSRMVKQVDDVQNWKTPAVVADHNGHIISFNSAACKLFGYRQDQALGEKVSMLMPPSVAQHHAQYMKRYLRGGDRKLIGKPRRMNAQHKDGYELPITLTMGEYVEKGKRFFIASFRDERQLTSDAELNNAIDATKARIIATVETEMLQFSEHYRSSDRRRRQLEEDNKTLTLALRDVKRQLTLQKAQLEELEKANQLLRHSSGNNRVSKSPSPAKVSSKGVGKKENEEEKSQLPAVLEDAFDTSLSDTVSSVSSSGGGRSITTINYDDVFISEKISDGRGMAADVYLCTVDGWTCAMKEFQVNDKTRETKRFQMFLKEIETLENLPHHPNICRYLFHSFSGKKLRLFTTKYSGTLRWKIEQTKEDGLRLSPGEIAKILVEILKGLKFLHSHNLAHRDLKSDNIFCMFSEENEVRKVAIGDFDTTKNITEDQMGKTCIGTPGYTAPEILKAHTGVVHDQAVDVWSFGMIIYELITLNRPYHELRDVQSIAGKILNGELPPLPALEIQYKPLVTVLRQCLSPVPENRPTVPRLRKELLRAYF